MLLSQSPSSREWGLLRVSHDRLSDETEDVKHSTTDDRSEYGEADGYYESVDVSQEDKDQRNLEQPVHRVCRRKQSQSLGGSVPKTPDRRALYMPSESKSVSAVADHVFAKHRKDDCGNAEHEAGDPVHVHPDDAGRTHVEYRRGVDMIKRARRGRRDRGWRRSRTHRGGRPLVEVRVYCSV